jgi:O-antigen/teichoic acid export membrane protein
VVQLAGIKIVLLGRTLVLGRLLSPEDFGLFAVALITIDFLMSVSEFGMVPALVQRDRLEKRHYDVAWTVGMLRAGMVGGAVALAAPSIAGLFDETRATDLLRVLAIRPLLDAAASVRVADLVRDLRFRSLTFLRLPEALANTAASIALARPLGVWALVVGPLAGSLLVLVASYLLAPYRPRLSLDRAAAQPLLRYGRWIFVVALLSVLGRSVLQLAISRRVGTAELGLYFLAAKLAFLPAEVSSEVVGSVAFPLYAQLKVEPRVAARTFRAILMGMMAVLLPVSLLLVTLAPSLVQDLLGERWQGAAPLIQVLAWVNVIGLFGDAVVPVLKGIGKPSQVAALELLQSLLLVGLAWHLAGRYGVIGAAFAWVPAIGSSQLLGAMFVRKALVRPFAGMARFTFAIVAASAMGAAAAWLTETRVAGLPGLVTAVAFGAAVTGAALWLFERRFSIGLADDLALAFPRAAGLIRSTRRETT